MIFSNIVYSLFSFSLVYSIPSPPTLVTEPGAELLFDPSAPFELPCLAQGDPGPVYKWIKDGLIYELNTTNNLTLMASDSGAITFTQPQISDQGWYQCNATNKRGTAVSRRVLVRAAELGFFPNYDKPQVIQVRRGDPLKILCRPPTGVPDPEIYWTDNTNSGNRMGYRLSNPRIQQDYDGNLYFLNVKDEDGKKQFLCNVFSRKLNLIRRGTLTQLKVIQSDPNNSQPTKLWSSDAYKVFLKGRTLSLKCIFAGLPTPDVLWRKVDGILPDRRSTVDAKKSELTISDLQFEDAGVYECRGQNELGYNAFSINVQIEAEPYWIQKPEDVHVGEGETVNFNCDAQSRPAPTSIQWFVNGVSLQNPSARRIPRRRIAKNRMMIQNLTKLDTAVYQCNVSNVHGYVFTNFFLNIISEKPDIQRGPDALYRVVEGQNVLLPCETFGAPKPKIYWSHLNQILSGGRYSTLDDGSLMIREALVTDDGVYICNATNKFGSDVRNGTLAVKQKTRIQTPPADQEVRRGYSALFRCTASSDKSLSHDIDWYKDGRLLSYTGAVNFNLCVGGVRRAGRLGRFIKDTLDKNTLKIVDVQFDDAGAYVCRASTEVDFDEATAALVVQDRPNRPKITKVNCSESAQNVSGQASAVVQWEAAGDNNARILYYELQYNTTFQPNDWTSVPIEQRRESFNEVKSPDGSIKLEPKITIFKTTHLPSSQFDLQVPLSCWVNYTFRIIAYNRIGPSDPSPVSESMCSTKPCRPKTNPVGMKALTTPASLLVIEWESMPAIKWAASKFWYEVGWRPFPTDSSTEPFLTKRVVPPQHQYVIPSPVMNMRYQYYVKAVNQQTEEGNGTEALEPLVYNVAFAGDAAPAYVPRNFRVLQMLDSTTVQFAWDAPLPADEVNIRGVLKAYQIEMFRLDDPENSRRVVSDILPNQTWTTVFNAPPNADVGAHICIETERYFGPTSAVIQFPTREGRPSAVSNLRAVPSASNGIFLLWDSPEETNGVIIGYQIDYSTIESIIAQPSLDQSSILLRDDTRRSYLLGGLKPNAKYRVQVRARTSVGLSTRPAIIELTTNLTLVPSKPTFTVTHRGTTFFNVSFDPTIMTVPGSLYYIDYRENDNAEQVVEKKSYAVSNDRTILVSGLEPGKTYITSLVAGDGISSETRSDPQMVATLGKGKL